MLVYNMQKPVDRKPKTSQQKQNVLAESFGYQKDLEHSKLQIKEINKKCEGKTVISKAPY